MNTTTKIILTAIFGIFVGAGGALAFSNNNESRTADMEHTMSNGTVMKGTMDMSGEMSGMMQGLNGKTGDDFDQAFLSEMIVHHQGAVQMAQAALQNAKHQEIKDLAQKIITAQNAEIAQMQGWQKNWFNQ